MIMTPDSSVEFISDVEMKETEQKKDKDKSKNKKETDLEEEKSSSNDQQRQELINTSVDPQNESGCRKKSPLSLKNYKKDKSIL